MIADLLASRGFILHKKTAKESSSPCPFCGGTDRFCIWPDDNRAWCRGCGWAGDDIQFYIDKDGMSFKDAATKAGRTDKIKDSPPPKTYGKITAHYNYVDESGTLLYQVLRLEPKDFRQRRPGDKARWIYKLDDTRLVLFDLPNILESKYVFFCEGEKDAIALKACGVPTTCNPMGAGKVPKQQLEHNILEPLRNKSVFILPDNDKAGKDHAEEVAKLLDGISSSTKILDLGFTEKGADISDWLGQHDTHPVDDLREIVKQTTIWKPISSFMDVNDLLKLTSNNHVPIMRGGILPAGEHLLIAGASGVGKSLLRLELAIHLAMGWQWLGKFEIPQARSVAIFQYENSVYNEQLRFKKMVEGLKIDQFRDGRIKFIDRIKRPNLSKVGDRESLERWVREADSEVVIYDCLSNIHSANENDNIKMREVLDILSDIDVKCNTSSILIHHFGKEQDSDNPRPNISRIRGASSLQDWASTIMSFAYTPNKEHKPIFELRVLKLREGPLHKWQSPLYFERDEFFICHPIEDPCACTPKQVRELLEKLGGSAGSNDLNEQVQDFAMCGKRQAYRFIKTAELERKIFSNKSGRNMIYSTSIYGEIGDK
jgi:5S rRNA maturation endonuclease (ribonuclease M5)